MEVLKLDIGQLIDERFILFDEQIRTKEELFTQASVLFESSGAVSYTHLTLPTKA